MLLKCGVGEYLESLLDCKEIQPVHPKGDQSWMFIGRTAAEAETPILWPPDAKNWLMWKDPDAGRDWRQEEKGMTEDVKVGWHHQLNGHEFGWNLEVGDGQGDLVCCNPWGRRVGHSWTGQYSIETLPDFTITYLKLSIDFKFTIKKGDTFKWLQNHPGCFRLIPLHPPPMVLRTGGR